VSNDVGELRTLTLEELVAETGIQAWRIRELIKEGKGPPHFRLGRRYRFPLSKVATSRNARLHVFLKAPHRFSSNLFRLRGDLREVSI
jgi:predicted DNA-binding transcriptional regulator AlpA